MRDIEKIWEDFNKRLRFFIKSKVSDRSVAQDLLQEVFLKIHMNIDELNDDTKITGWVFKIARNTVIDYYRKRKDHVEDIDENDIVYKRPETSPEDEIASGLLKMVKELPDKYAVALIKVDFEGLSQAEFAKKYGISVSGAKSRVQRARRLVRDRLLECCHFDFDRFGTIVDFRPNCCCCIKTHQ